jgi:hypothetical protein
MTKLAVSLELQDEKWWKIDIKVAISSQTDEILSRNSWFSPLLLSLCNFLNLIWRTKKADIFCRSSSLKFCKIYLPFWFSLSSWPTELVYNDCWNPPREFNLGSKFPSFNLLSTILFYSLLPLFSIPPSLSYPLAPYFPTLILAFVPLLSGPRWTNHQ